MQVPSSPSCAGPAAPLGPAQILLVSSANEGAAAFFRRLLGDPLVLTLRPITLRVTAPD